MALAALITWNYAFTDETGFLLQRSVDSGSTWTVNYPQPITTSYVDAAVVDFGTYWYRIAATNKYGTGSWSNTGSVFILPAPGAPYNLQVVSGSSILTWHSGSGQTDYYTVQRSTQGGPFSEFTVALIETATDTSVSASYTGNTYTYQVAAIDAVGTSSFTAPASIMFQQAPLAPTILSVTSGSSVAIITFESGSDGTDYYPFEASLDGVNWYFIGSVAGPPIGNDTGVSGSYTGNTYYYRCYGHNNAGNSPYSNTGSITFGFPPPPPINVQATSGSAIVTWTFVGTANQTASIYRSRDEVNYTFLDAVNGGLETYTDNTVTASYAGERYYYKVVGANQFGYSDYSVSSSISFSFVPPAPTLTVSSGSAIVSASFVNIGTTAVARIFRSLNGGSYGLAYLQSIDQNGISFRDNAVVSNTGSGNTYSYRSYVQASSGLTSSFSDTASITFAYTPVPTVPLNLTVTSGSAILNWDASQYADYYNVERSLDGVIYTYYANNTSPTYTDTGVSSSIQGNTYWYRVYGVNGTGNSGLSNTASITFFAPIIISTCSSSVFPSQYITESLNPSEAYYPQPVTSNVADMVWNIVTTGNTFATMSGGWGTFTVSSSGAPTTITMTSQINFPSAYMVETDARFDFYNDPAGGGTNFYTLGVTYNETTSSATGYNAAGSNYGYVQPLGGLTTLPSGINHVTLSVVYSGANESNMTGSFAFFKWP